MSQFVSVIPGFLLILLSGVFGVVPAQAAIIDAGMTLVDTDSGLEWLDVTESWGRSYNDVSAQFGAGGDFEGYRLRALRNIST